MALRLYTPNAEGLGLIPGQGTRSHMPQLRLKILRASTKTQCSQINERIFFKKKKRSVQLDGGEQWWGPCAIRLMKTTEARAGRASWVIGRGLDFIIGTEAVEGFKAEWTGSTLYFFRSTVWLLGKGQRERKGQLGGFCNHAGKKCSQCGSRRWYSSTWWTLMLFPCLGYCK